MTILCLALCLGIASAMRIENVEKSEVDCNWLSPPDEEFSVWRFNRTSFAYAGEVVQRPWLNGSTGPVEVWKTNVDPRYCGTYFVYLEAEDRYVALKKDEYWYPPALKYKSFCSAGEVGSDQIRFCANPEGGVVWNYVKKTVPKKCMDVLCALAVTGGWRSGYLKWTAKKSPWERKISSDRSFGFEDVFNQKCWHGPKKGFGDALGDFEHFAKEYQIITSKGTFNKKVCGCKTEDVC